MKSGILVIDKPSGMTSRDVVNVVCKELQTRKIGHTGTLDPLATGVLVLAVNQATRGIELLTQQTKEYVATVLLGIETDTLDVTGNIIKRQDKNVDRKEIERVLASFIGKSLQEVPIYSAVHVEGKRLYEYARENKKVELPQREIEVSEIELLETSLEQRTFTFRVLVSKGTYIRSLIRDIGRKLDCCCTMQNLRRMKQGHFSISQAITLDQVTWEQVQSLATGLSEFERFTVSEEELFSFQNGQVLPKRFAGKYGLFFTPGGRLLAIYQTYDKDSSKMKPYCVFHEEDAHEKIK